MPKTVYKKGCCPHCGAKVNCRMISPKKENEFHLPPCFNCLKDGKPEVILTKELQPIPEKIIEDEDKYIRKKCLKCPKWINHKCIEINGLLCPLKDTITLSYLDWLFIKHALDYYDIPKGAVFRLTQHTDKLRDE